MERKEISKTNLIGWSLTITLSLFGGWMSTDARVYETEKQVELVKQEQQSEKEFSDRQLESNKEMMFIINRIDKGVVEIKGKLDLKADKKFIQ